MEKENEIKKQVKKYFNAGAADFDSIYSGEKNRLSAWLDRVLRWDMQARFEETMKECRDVEGVDILDVGCGSGRYMVPLAKRGAIVTGVDCAPEMLSIAGKFAGMEGVAENCRFVEGDLLAVELGRLFPVTLAIGFFDYIADSHSYLVAMRNVTRGRLIASFPRFWTWRAPVRKLRLALKGCPVYFFTRRRVIRLLRESGWEAVRITRLGKLHFVVARSKETHVSA